MFAIAGVAVALLLPMYTCSEGYRFLETGPGGGPTCLVFDMGYRPTSWLPTKLIVAGAGLVAATAILLWAKGQRWIASGLVVAFAGVAALWLVA